MAEERPKPKVPKRWRTPDILSVRASAASRTFKREFSGRPLHEINFQAAPIHRNRRRIVFIRQFGPENLSFDQQQHIGRKQQQVHDALQNVGAAAREGDDIHGERQQQQDEIGML